MKLRKEDALIKDIVRQLLHDDNIVCGEAVNPRCLGECKQYLADMKYCDLPAEYLALLSYANGIRSHNAVLFGVFPNDAPNDIVAANEDYGRESKVLLLGRTDWDVLVYDAENKDYRVRSTQDLSLAEVFDNLEDALRYWFGM